MTMLSLRTCNSSYISRDASWTNTNIPKEEIKVELRYVRCCRAAIKLTIWGTASSDNGLVLLDPFRLFTREISDEPLPFVKQGDTKADRKFCPVCISFVSLPDSKRKRMKKNKKNVTTRASWCTFDISKFGTDNVSLVGSIHACLWTTLSLLFLAIGVESVNLDIYCAVREETYVYIKRWNICLRYHPTDKRKSMEAYSTSGK